MKIGIEVQRLFRKNKFGIETSSLELIRALRNLEPRHEYVIFVKDDIDHRCLPPAENMKIRRVAGSFFADFEQLHLPIAARQEQVDILHCTGNTTPYFSPVPVVQTLHDVIFMDAISSSDNLYQRFGNHYRRRVVPLVTPRSQAVITVSHYERERIIQRLGIKPEKIHVIYNGINDQRFYNGVSFEKKTAVREKYHLPETFILFLGNTATRKNPVRAIEAYLKYSAQTQHPVPLVTPGLSQKYIAEKLRHLGCADKANLFITPGYIDDGDLPVLYALSLLFLFPSLSEGFGMPLIEAMACGAPVVTASTTCLPEIAGSAAMLANPLDTDEMAIAISSVATNESLRNRLISAGLENAKRFSWRSTAESVLNIYESAFAEAQVARKHPGFFHKYVYAGRD